MGLVGKGDCVGIKPLDGENYDLWSWRLSSVFIGRGLWNIVSGKTPAPNASSEDSVKDECMEKNGQAMAIIKQFVTDNMARPLIKLETAHEMWSYLSNRSKGQTTNSRSHLVKELSSLKKKQSESMESYP